MEMMRIDGIAAGCHDCRYWDKEKSKRGGVEVAECLLLSNDFCCGGYERWDAGYIGGGNFETKGTFLCKYWQPHASEA